MVLSRHAVIDVSFAAPRFQLSSPEIPMSRTCCVMGAFEYACRLVPDSGGPAIPIAPFRPPRAGTAVRAPMIPAKGPSAVCTAPQQDSLRLE